MGTGLRDRKREKLRTAILDAAVALARKLQPVAQQDDGRSGFEAMRVKDLSERVEISEATFFNYFASKSALLDAWVRRDLANAFAIFSEANVADRSLRAGVRAAIQGLAEEVARHGALAVYAWPRARPLLAKGGADPVEPLAKALERAREAAELRRDIEPEELAVLLISALVAAAGRALESGCSGPVALEERLRRAAELVLDGARRRHERVRVAARVGVVASP